MAPSFVRAAFSSALWLSLLVPSDASALIAQRAGPTLPTGWTYQGCYVDNLNGRILGNRQADNTALTVEKCIATCAGLGYSVAGMEYSSECYCDNYLINGGTKASADSQCSNTCSGNSAEQCGGANRMSVYAKGTLVVRQAPGPQKTGLPGSWAYQGCITEGTNNNKIWKYQIVSQNANSPTTCLSACQKFGYQAAGLEYGTECYCGDDVDRAAGGSTAAPESDCSTSCSGDSQYLCGGGNRLTWYLWKGAPLYVWNYPTGAAAGQYQLLIGGVCVPLLTTSGVNGKYTFVEKYGTGPPNSTGAYELDVSQIGNPSLAWREMHVKTDVFCSASITLPDKAGRQINIGGWSGESTFGIRLYWPDGSPGVASTNDWQENVNELTLQKGRWYPSAMVMTNGSILVIGGETGSNGPPQPNLEILPRPGGAGVVDLDWLRRTDPNNLYPFLAVVPSGILVIYYNEARILDERTFATIKTLPNLPGGVNNPGAGRTYPLEGTTMLLPQYAPFSDPLGVLVCGGSTVGAGLALDNCVSTQPEAANPQWTIERMPSQRVMPCMTALPDGTYMILNGAHQGVAGFGLATDPNHNAVLYDPSKPVNQRMSVMANTTIDRLYHSEAILMQDGRVLVSGSDPQDNVHPEEYRVEVFVPPYLLSGKARPSFTIANKNWAYGASIPITVKLNGGGTTRVSMMGAESSTHGNSMGQRTLFPAVSCAGTTCTITAPPNAHVAPLGWYQLFLLDGPTPSVSTWIRLGGDPASLGNWPPYADFKKPGV
ncbi:MAG: hypothetical protein LQ350_005706 [Teloschistes chrysophthalmus]|nr:MAG: hypothetical protein LQ350_005706 [Niorma chrysophthalma]